MSGSSTGNQAHVDSQGQKTYGVSSSISESALKTVLTGQSADERHISHFTVRFHEVNS